MRYLIEGVVKPDSGDLVLGRIDRLGRQKKIELTDGRKSQLFPGDEVIVAYGNRYAPDQYEAVIGPDLSSCGLVASGGVAGQEITRHLRVLPATGITPIGLIGGADGRRLNLRDFRVETVVRAPSIPVVLSLGTSMNAGKTLTSMSLVRGFKRAGLRVAALKATGTGSGGDVWIMKDAGADCVLDFTDAGYASTYLASIPGLESAFWRLVCAAEDQGCSIAVVEIADGLQQLETAQLVRSPMVKQCVVGATFAAYDSMGAICGVEVLRSAGHDVLALSGRLGMSPLGVREAEAATGVRLYSPSEFQEGALVPAVLEAIEARGRGGVRAAIMGLPFDHAGALAGPSSNGRPHAPDDLTHIGAEDSHAGADFAFDDDDADGDGDECGGRDRDAPFAVEMEAASVLPPTAPEIAALTLCRHTAEATTSRSDAAR